MSASFFCPRCRGRITSDGGSHATCPGCGLVIDLALADTLGRGSTAGASSYLPIPDLSGTTVGHYHLSECLGAGGMGTVYQARSTLTNEVVAIKVLSPAFLGQPDLVERFHREARALAGLDHANIVGYRDEGQADGHHFIAMEYVEGESLESLLTRETVSTQRAVDLVIGIADALGAAHQQGIIHRDLKPANVIVNGDTVKVLDFGIAHVALEDLTLTHSDAILGTINYMAPEQRIRARQVDHRADIFSLGALFYRCLTGALPLGAFESPSQLRRGIPRSVDRVVERMLHRDPERRHTDIDELLRKLRALSQPTVSPARVAAWAAALAAVVLTGVLVARSGDDNPAVATRDVPAVSAEPSPTVPAFGKEVEPTANAVQIEPPTAAGKKMAPSPKAPVRNTVVQPAKPAQNTRLRSRDAVEGTRGAAGKNKNPKQRPAPAHQQAAPITKGEAQVDEPVTQAQRQPAAAPRGKRFWVVSSGSVLYVAATAESEIVRPLAASEQVFVHMRRRGKDKQRWAAVRTTRGESGWVRNSSLQSTKPRSQQTRPKVGKKPNKSSSTL